MSELVSDTIEGDMDTDSVNLTEVDGETLAYVAASWSVFTPFRVDRGIPETSCRQDAGGNSETDSLDEDGQRRERCLGRRVHRWVFLKGPFFVC